MREMEKINDFSQKTLAKTHKKGYHYNINRNFGLAENEGENYDF